MKHDEVQSRLQYGNEYGHQIHDTFPKSVTNLQINRKRWLKNLLQSVINDSMCTGYAANLYCTYASRETCTKRSYLNRETVIWRSVQYVYSCALASRYIVSVQASVMRYKPPTSHSLVCGKKPMRLKECDISITFHSDLTSQTSLSFGTY